LKDWKFNIDLILKLHYSQGVDYQTPIGIKFVPFSPCFPTHSIEKWKDFRKEILNNKSFKHSLIWTGNPRISSIKYIRQSVQNTLCNSKYGVSGFFEIDDYFQKSCQSLASVGIHSLGEFCCREQEFMGLGIPYIHKGYKCITHNIRLPNVHFLNYYDATEPNVEYFLNYFEPNGELKQFTQEEWDQYITIINNAKKWYDENVAIHGSWKLLLAVLEQNNII